MLNIDDIISDLTGCAEGITNALLKTKVLLFSLEAKDPVTWVNYELNGYPDTQFLPDYRILQARILINANNSIRSYKRLEVPLDHLEGEALKRAKQCRIDLSISQIEQLLKDAHASDNSSFQQSIPIEYARYYARRVDESYEITRIYKDIAIHGLTSIVTQVRARLLDFLLELRSQTNNIQGDSMLEKAKMVDAAAIFSNAVFGHNTTINFGHNSTITVSNTIKTNDFNSLKENLQKNGVNDNDIDELHISILEDDRIATKSSNAYGPKVSSWYAKMIQKAANSTWDIGVSAATAVLTSALNQYFGISS